MTLQDAVPVLIAFVSIVGLGVWIVREDAKDEEAPKPAADPLNTPIQKPVIYPTPVAHKKDRPLGK